MKLAIMQPYFFPYIGYFQLMKNVDRWVVFDDIQFIDKGWINRNRVLHPDVTKKWQYISIPLKKHKQFDSINKIKIDGSHDWKAEILGKLTCYKKKAPYYKRTMKLVNDCLAYDESNLALFAENCLRLVAAELGINVKIDVQSKLGLELGRIDHPGQWALKIAEALHASEYINPSGGYSIFSEDEFTSRCIQLRFLRPHLTPYIQRRDGFVPGLSIIDVMMWNGDAEISKMLTQDFDILRQGGVVNEQ